MIPLRDVQCLVSIFRSNPPSRPNHVSKMFFRPSRKSYFDFSEIWYVGTGRQVMHDGMQYVPIQDQGHEPLKVGYSVIFNGYVLPHLQWGLANDHGFLFLTLGHKKAYRDRIFVLVFLCHVTLKLAVSRSRPSVPYGANLLPLESIKSYSAHLYTPYK